MYVNLSEFYRLAANRAPVIDKQSQGHGTPSNPMITPVHEFHVEYYVRDRTIRFCAVIGSPTSKGTIQFPADKPLPDVLLKKIVRARVKENREWD